MFELDKLYNADCMAGMKEIPDKYFDLAIVDPPYGVNVFKQNHYRDSEQYGNAKAAPRNYARKEWDNTAPPLEYFSELFRVSKNQIIWGANHFISRIPYDSACWVVWDKDNGTNDFADCELAWTSFNTAVRRFKYRWSGMLQENMKQKEIRIHPTQKPVALYEWLLDKYAKPGDLILDTHVGSASSLIACYRGGFRFVGFEIDPEYYKAANERLSAEMAQIRLIDAGGDLL